MRGRLGDMARRRREQRTMKCQIRFSILDSFKEANIEYDLETDPFWNPLYSVFTAFSPTINKSSEDFPFIFPNMLMFRAIMAFFIGIFIHLIIQDKSIMEPI